MDRRIIPERAYAKFDPITPLMTSPFPDRIGIRQSSTFRINPTRAAFPEVDIVTATNSRSCSAASSPKNTRMVLSISDYLAVDTCKFANSQKQKLNLFEALSFGNEESDTESLLSSISREVLQFENSIVPEKSENPITERGQGNGDDSPWSLPN